MDDNKIKISLAAIDQYITDNIVKPEEIEVRGHDWVEFGVRDCYPSYLYGLYLASNTLNTLVNACPDYVKGDNIESHIHILSDRKATELVGKIARSLFLYGGAYLNILRNRMGGVAQIDVLDYRYVRSNKKNTEFFYSEDFNKKTYGRIKAMKYPKFGPEKKDASSILYLKTNNDGTYSLPRYVAAVKGAEAERLVDDYHINNLNNNFSSNYIVAFCNGIPNDQIKEEIEELINEKYTGVENSGRPVITYSDDKDHAPQIIKLDSEDWGEKYKSLIERASQSLYTAFRCTPNIIGIPTQTTGFNSQEYAGAFKLFNRTVIQPYQKLICQTLDEIFGEEDCITIEPYSIDFEEGGSNVDEITATETVEEV